MPLAPNFLLLRHLVPTRSALIVLDHAEARAVHGPSILRQIILARLFAPQAAHLSVLQAAPIFSPLAFKRPHHRCLR